MAPLYPLPRCALNLPTADDLIGLLLDPLDTRGRCVVPRDTAPTIQIADPEQEEWTGPDDETVNPIRDHIMTIEHELRWIWRPVLGYPHPDPHQPVRFGPLKERYLKTQTTDIDRTKAWHWADLRQSRIRKSVAASGVADVPRARRLDETAIDRADLGRAIQTLTDGEHTAVFRRFAGYPLTSGQRVQLMRALAKSSQLRKRFRLITPITNKATLAKEIPRGGIA